MSNIRIKKNSQPLFSIVTVVLNGEKHIERCIKSVLAQKVKNFEYIIVDGKSKDRTMTIINKYKNKIKKIISKKDRGIYDAFNKGMSLCSGKYICFVKLS